MNTRLLAPPLLALVLSFSLASCATASSAQIPAPPTFELTGGRRLNVVSGYLRNQPDAVVRGFVRRDPLWRGPVDGHLHITAYAANGEVIARQATTWVGRFTESHGPPLAYQADLKVSRGEVARIAVTFAAERHSASESFQ